MGGCWSSELVSPPSLIRLHPERPLFRPMRHPSRRLSRTGEVAGTVTDPTVGTFSVLFTDIVASTELRAKLGEEAADEFRRTHDQLLAEAVESHGGKVVK